MVSLPPAFVAQRKFSKGKRFNPALPNSQFWPYHLRLVSLVPLPLTYALESDGLTCGRLGGPFPWLLHEHWGLKMAKLPTHVAAFCY
jgi:hypothetical protein